MLKPIEWEYRKGLGNDDTGSQSVGYGGIKPCTVGGIPGIGVRIEPSPATESADAMGYACAAGKNRSQNTTSTSSSIS